LTATIPTSIVGGENEFTEVCSGRNANVDRFKRKLNKALRWQAIRGKVTKEEAAVIRKALDSPKIVKHGRTYAEQLFHELYQIAGGLFEDLETFFWQAVDWLVENWDKVLKVAFSILLMLI